VFGTSKVHIVDDDEAVRHSLEMLLDSMGLPVTTYDSAARFLEIAPGLEAGCVLTDIRMPEIDGLTLQRRLAATAAHLPVIVMTGHADVPLAVRALKTGALDFLEKPFDDEHLVQVLRAALARAEENRAARARWAATMARLESLTPREREVLDRLILGHPNKVIAHELGTSPRTVEVQRARVMEKMGAAGVVELVRMMMRPGDQPRGAPSGTA